MYPGLLLVPLVYALILAGLALVPGLVALALALATKKAAGSFDEERQDALGCFGAAIHGVSRGVGVVLLAVSCGFVGAGLFSVCLNVALMAIALISYWVSPTAGANMDASLFVLLYLGLLFLSFLGFFALGMDHLVRWIKPKDA
jgi:hypothetical protein